MNNKILVLTVSYSEYDFVHPRNIAYKNNGYDVTVLDFKRKEECLIDGIRIIGIRTYKKEKSKYNHLILHAPNLKNHYLFLIMFGKYFDHFMFFYHGHEVLLISQVYSKPYDYKKQNGIVITYQNIYDKFKLFVWRSYLPKLVYKSDFIFVSNWMKKEFYRWTRIPKSVINNKEHVIYNCIGEVFEQTCFNIDKCNKEYDFITVRSNIDGSKYCVDFVNDLARANKWAKFLLIGCGDFFNYYDKAENIVHIEKIMSKSEIVKYLQKTRCALMPTRTDAQGVMMCEMASIGMPVITSDIPICHEIFEGFSNVSFINLNNKETNLKEILFNLEVNQPYKQNDKYYKKNTCFKELSLFQIS